jgi:protein involved in polysaccharide export with SLBB domain
MKRILITLVLLFFNLPGLHSQILEPGDGVRISFYNISAEDVSRDFYVQKDGALQLPYIGIIPTNDKEFSLLRSEIEMKYDSLYREVELIILPLYRISVLGEVRTPGVYYVTGVEKLLDVIALAGGETADSDMSEIYVERSNVEFVFDAEELIQGEGNLEDFYLKSGDRVYISRKWGTSRSTAILISGAGLLVAIVALVVR